MNTVPGNSSYATQYRKYPVCLLWLDTWQRYLGCATPLPMEFLMYSIIFKCLANHLVRSCSWYKYLQDSASFGPNRLLVLPCRPGERPFVLLRGCQGHGAVARAWQTPPPTPWSAGEAP